jgi:hypothetical protein
MTRILCALAVISLGGLAWGVSPALGAFPGDNGKIVFDSERGGDFDIWTMSPNGRNARHRPIPRPPASLGPTSRSS